ncbi:MAG: SDR family oxidoreductase [Alphaproteobacteria bacterium]|nr:SDR family oxidoreductase [Alphaproteobacteria bacterium]
MTSPQSLFSLTGRVALVTGARRGLGAEIARALASAGAHVAVNGRSAAALAPLVAELGAAEPLAFDVRDEAAAQAAIEGLVARQGRLDILVNNVGARDRRGLFEFSLAEARELIDTDLLAAFTVSRACARPMIAARHGRIVNVTSIAGRIARAGDAIYTAAKAGLDGLSKALAAELGPHGITVNAVAPGFFATETNAAMVSDAETTHWVRRRTALQRWGEPREIAGAVVFLASDGASYVTGQTLVVDGGMTSLF